MVGLVLVDGTGEGSRVRVLSVREPYVGTVGKV